ncbi:hypothetical protein DDD64_03385 [Actinotignum sanguinis]|nr:hypothetical protein DDD64_03385 [Actinotignum sanguinis]
MRHAGAMFVAALRSWATALGDLIFPRWCAGCGAWDTTLCPVCTREVAGSWRGGEGRAPALMQILPNGDEEALFPVFALGEYIGVRRQALLTWKHGNDAALTARFATLFAQRCRQLAPLWEGTALSVIPAPSGPARHRSGRFIAGHLAQAAVRGLGAGGVDARAAPVLLSGEAQGGVPLGVGNGVLSMLPAQLRDRVVHAAKEKRARAGQRHLAGQHERAAKGRGIRLRPGITIPGRVILVDDVLTTGSTLAGCARAIAQAGGQVLAALVLALAPDPRPANSRTALSLLQPFPNVVN